MLMRTDRACSHQHARNGSIPRPAALGQVTGKTVSTVGAASRRGYLKTITRASRKVGAWFSEISVRLICHLIETEKIIVCIVGPIAGQMIRASAAGFV
jgi:hypothetical protein